MSLAYHMLKRGRLFADDYERMLPILNAAYETAEKTGNVKHFTGHSIDCFYAFSKTSILPSKDVKRAIGFGACFPKSNGSRERKIIIFEDIFDSYFLEIGLAHEDTHVHDNESTTEQQEENKAYAAEMHVAELAGKKQAWIDYNKREYPWRIETMRKFGLL